MTTTLSTAPALISEPSRAERRAAAPFLPHARISGRSALWIFTMAVALVCPLIAAIGLLHLPQSELVSRMAHERMMRRVQEPGGLFILAVIAMPLLEEIFYRGLLLQLLRRYCPLWVAALVSSAAFGASHLGQGYANALAASVLGLGFAWLVVRTRSLFASILCHATVNFAWLFLFIPGFGLLEKMLVLDPKLPPPAINPLTDLFPAWWLVLSLGLLVSGWRRRDRALPRDTAA